MSDYLKHEAFKKRKKTCQMNLNPFQILGLCIFKKSTWTIIENELELKQNRIENLRNRLNQLYYN